MAKYRLELLDKFACELNNEHFINQSKGFSATAFTRSRKFTLKRLIVLIMILKSSYQREINKFCKQLIKGDYNIRQATAGALTQARAKLKPYAFIRLREIAVSTFYEKANYTKWRGYRLVAVDGSVLNLPHSQSIIKEFGSEDYINKKSGQKSLARCSLLYDVLNHVTIDSQISGYKTSEKTLLEGHLSNLVDTDLILGDRGYAYSSIIHWLSERNVNFCFRFQDSKMKVVKQFAMSNEQEKEIDLELDGKTLKKLSLTKSPSVKVRLIKVYLDNGEVEVLGTSLLDKKKYNKNIFKDLYHKRWGVEEAFKILKCRINLEDFTGRTAHSVYQDFHAKTLMMTLCAVMSHPIEIMVRKEYTAAKTNNKYDQQINRTDALSETKNNIFWLFIENRRQDLIDAMDKVILASRTIIRPKRKIDRIKTVRKRKPLNYKQL